jgi:hypothetical protein
MKIGCQGGKESFRINAGCSLDYTIENKGTGLFEDSFSLNPFRT